MLNELPTNMPTLPRIAKDVWDEELDHYEDILDMLGIPPTAYVKIAGQVKWTRFISPNGVFQTSLFQEAVVKEIEDWINRYKNA